MTVSSRPHHVLPSLRAVNGARFLSAGALLLLSASAPAMAQGTALSLGDAARLAARQNGAVEVARTRIAAADARVLQRRGALLPDLAAGIQQAGRTTNSATFGFEFRDPTGRPLLNPNGQLIGPVRTIDMRYRLQQPLLDLGNVAKWRAAQSASAAVTAEVNAQADASAALAALAYVRAARSEAHVAARAADSTLAADLLRIARDQLQAGVGIALDVTRAQSQLAATHAQLIGARNDRDRALLELKRVLGLSLDAPLTLRDSLGGLPEEAAAVDERAVIAQAADSRADVRALALQQEADDGVARLTDDEVAPGRLKGRRVGRAKLGLEDLVQAAVGQLTQGSPEGGARRFEVGRPCWGDKRTRGLGARARQLTQGSPDGAGWW